MPRKQKTVALSDTKEFTCPISRTEIPVTLLATQRLPRVVKLAATLLDSGPGSSQSSLHAPLLP